MKPTRTPLAALLALFAPPFQDPGGTSATVLPEPEAEVFHQAVDWSPDGKWLAYSEFAGGELAFDKWAIHVVAADGSDDAERRLVARGGIFCSWSPDGRRIAHDAFRDENWDVYVTELEGGAERRVTEHAAKDSQPAWSPRGDRLAFVSDRAGNADVYVVELASGAVTQLTTDEAEDMNPAWSPDGSTLVFFREKGDGKDQIWVVGADGKGERRVTAGERHNFYPSFLPDGRVGFTRVLEDGTKTLFAAKLDGSGLARVGDVPVSFARWSPDGEQVAFVGGRWPKSAIYLMNADGTGLRKRVN